MDEWQSRQREIKLARKGQQQKLKKERWNGINGDAESGITSQKQNKKRKTMQAKLHQTYSETHRGVRRNANLKETGAEIKKVRKTRSGHVVLRLRHKERDPERTTLEIWNLDCLITLVEVQETVKRKKFKLAKIQLNERSPTDLLKRRWMKIG